ncbi:heptahelical transmembrane protein ADIPOR1 isoform X1 [Amborella trichopoda]|uniref:Uncharacterized protein n=1 Tax=Amborella trichopoda TaxID=13333 RepID=U5CWK0_AMBTC|nr:heptahelical transmembrane protein ADIPOR1 isoform X1 [Amborella trichopoda]ERN14335.1 hypothetical protein AMTR_s00033p00203190 [Amborella trichopoda]|eukprot:XP_006852868.1 heptahelical transmembrane protein ADIPOR1 isoform X1 [Amborella trichopoda]
MEEKKEGRKCKKKNLGLVNYEELPNYMKDNEYILHYYRVEWPLKEAFLSVFSWHNETLNVWTHFGGFFLFLGLTIMHLVEMPGVLELLSRIFWPLLLTSSKASYKFGNSTMTTALLQMPGPLVPVSGTQANRWPLFVFLGGSMFCLLTSSLCHLLCCHSQRLNHFLWRLDYGGISIMIVASFFPPIYYIFQCEPLFQVLYLSAISVMGILVVVTLLSPELSSPAFRKLRAMLFLAMGFSGIIPAVHALVVNWNEPLRFITLAYELAMAFFYGTGTFFYVSRVPEKWKPGSFDMAGHSHQIFHVFVVAGAIAHYDAAMIFLKWRDTVGCNQFQ